jgi:NAD(P) transhydrogenase subunit alpha
MSASLLLLLFVVASVAGLKVVSEVPPLLHTPLMSGMNALSGVTVLGAVVATAVAVETSSRLLGAVAIICATTNVVGGFSVTHRMLKMFQQKSQVQRD